MTGDASIGFHVKAFTWYQYLFTQFRAFFVYFPSMIKGAQSGLPVPDFGRLRWIW